ncbi:hypothetical protein FQN54_007964 [Arachnomyces sp. PD_36]|nr:hypothetical protein FQN54_007964 [Arachnomyces sp. PD_36]
MTSPDDATPVKPPPSFSPETPLVASKARFSEKLQSSQPIIPPLPDSSISSSASVPPSSTSSRGPSRSNSPNGRVSHSASRLTRSSTASPLGVALDGSDDIRSLIIRAFSPAIAVYASEDAEELVRRKGFKNGFQELLRPFGETILGKIVIRDSVGSSRGWEDFGVRFVGLGAGNTNPQGNGKHEHLTQIEEALERHLDSADEPLGGWIRTGDSSSGAHTSVCPFYKLFLRRLLSSTTLTPHETFAHPVACVIVISSRNPEPLESLRQLYADTSQGDKRSPPWVHPEYLRYYVLVHDEDRDDIGRSTALFDQMKRHFGLHCHMLRLRSNQCVLTDDDSIQFPTPEWLSPSEDLSRMGEKEVLIDVETAPPYLFESDMTAIRIFIREMVAQSVIPHMENRVSFWNDQVASKRRGISGRFMSMSRRWAGFGSGSRTSGGSGSSSSGNYEPEGYYKPETPEALLRKMADYAFMLRDWKLSTSTYELLRSDFSNDKAWRHHAGVNEMCAISTLLNPLATAAKFKPESIDQMLDTACYSYLTRCSDSQNALRSLSLGVELLKSRGGSATESAAKWAMRIQEMGLVGPVGQILFRERVSACFASKIGTGGARLGARRRKAAMWSVLASDSWLQLGKPTLASACLEEADRLYGEVLGNEAVFPLPEMQSFVDGIRHAVKVEYLEARGLNVEDETVEVEQIETEETSEKLDRRNHRKSLIGTVNPLEARPPSPARLKSEDDTQPDDYFE